MTPLNSEEWEARLSKAMASLMDIATDEAINKLSQEEISGYAVRLTALNMVFDMYNKTMVGTYLTKTASDAQDYYPTTKTTYAVVDSMDDIYRLLRGGSSSPKKKDDPPKDQ